MRWVIRIWPGPSAGGLDPHLAPNAAMPSMDPRMARHGQARRGSHAIRGSAPGTEQSGLLSWLNNRLPPASHLLSTVQYYRSDESSML